MATAVQVPSDLNLKSPEKSTEVDAALAADAELLKALNQKTYKEQAIWFLNAYWKSGPTFGDNLDQAEVIWNYVHVCQDLDPNGAEGNELDEFNAHRVLEKFDETLTVKEMRDLLRDMDLDFNMKVSLTEFLVYKYRIDWRELVHAPQGDVDKEKMDLAAKKVADAKQSIEKCKKVAGEARATEREAKSSERTAVESEAVALKSEEKAEAAESEAKEAEAQAKEAEKISIDAEREAKSTEVQAVENETKAVEQEQAANEAEVLANKRAEETKVVEAELKTALEELHSQEQAFQKRLDKLEHDSKDTSKGIVSRGTAANELAQLKTTDPLPLQRAKISQEAVVRRQTKATKDAAASAVASKRAKENAETSRQEAEKSRENAVESRKEAELRLQDATAKRETAENTLNEQIATRNKAQANRELAQAKRQEAEENRKNAESKAIAAETALQASNVAYKEALEFLEQVKKEIKGAGQGKLYYMDRELEESKKFLSPKQLALLSSSKA